jgi:hypothetical protein
MRRDSLSCTALIQQHDPVMLWIEITSIAFSDTTSRTTVAVCVRV